MICNLKISSKNRSIDEISPSLMTRIRHRDYMASYIYAIRQMRCVHTKLYRLTYLFMYFKCLFNHQFKR